MTNTIQTVSSNAKKLVKMAAADLADQIHFFKAARKMSESEFKPDKSGHSPGDTVSVRIPAQAEVIEDNFDITSAIKDIKERSVDMVLNKSATTNLALTTNELAHTTNIGEVYDRYLKGYVQDMAASIEARFIKEATQNTANLVGTAGSTSVDTDTVMSGRDLLGKNLCPKGKGRTFLMDATAMRSAVNENKSLFVFGKEEWGQGYIGDALGFSWLENELLYRHTNGNDVTGVAVEASVVTIATGMTTLGVDGLTNDTGTITKGTVFTLAGVYAVHPQTKATLPFLKQFVHVGADVTANSSGQATLTLDEPIYSSASGSLQNVSALPVDETSTLTFVGAASTAYTQSLMFHKEAFRVVSVPLALPTNAEFAEQASESGINIAIVRDYDQLTRKFITRLDFLGGIVPVRPRWAVRVTA
jgi:hypothetical protein